MGAALNVHGKRDKIKIKKIFAIKIPHSPSRRSFFISLACFHGKRMEESRRRRMFEKRKCHKNCGKMLSVSFHVRH